MQFRAKQLLKALLSFTSGHLTSQINKQDRKNQLLIQIIPARRIIQPNIPIPKGLVYLGILLPVMTPVTSISLFRQQKYLPVLPFTGKDHNGEDL